MALPCRWFSPPFRSPDELLKVSYDATREFLEEADTTLPQEHPDVTVRTSHAGSGQLARTMPKGLKADVVTPVIPFDGSANPRSRAIHGDTKADS